MALLGNKDFADVMKVRPEMTSSWTRLDPKSEDTCAYKGQSRRKHTQSRGHVKTKQRLDDTATSQGTPGAPRGWEREHGPAYSWI